MLSVLALLLSLAAPVAYLATMKVPFLRETGIVAYSIMGVAIVLGIVAARRRPRWWSKVVVILQILLLGAFIYGFEVWARLPGDPAFEKQEEAADFRLPDASGRPVSLSEAVSRGPVLLVFFRGRW